MGNCIGKKSTIHHKQRRHAPSTNILPTKLYYNNQGLTEQAPSLVLTSLSTLNISSEQSSIFLSHLSDAKETDIVFNDNDENERKVIQYSSLALLATTTPPPPTNEPLVYMHTSSPVQLSSECKKYKSSNATIVLSENNIKQPFAPTTTNEPDTTMGHLFSKETDINKENDNSHSYKQMNIDIKVHMTDNDQSKSHQYFTFINDEKLPNNETMVNTKEIIQGKLNSISTSFF